MFMVIERKGDLSMLSRTGLEARKRAEDDDDGVLVAGSVADMHKNTQHESSWTL